MVIIDVLGWIGSIFLIGAYWLVSKNKITAQSKPYQTLNILGSILLTINTLYHGAYPSSAVNIIWVFIGGYFLLNVIFRPPSKIA